MNIFLYTILFFIGVIVGEFWKSAIYRIPRNISFTQKGVAYIEPNVKLNKISQLFYPVLGGILFIVFGQILKININNINIETIIIYIFTIIYISILIIMAGIDQKFLKIEKSAITSGIILTIIYMIYIYKINPATINISIISLGIYIILLAIDTFIIKRYAKSSYTIGIITLFNIIMIFTGIDVFTYTLIMTAMEIIVCLLISKINQKKNGNKKVKISNIPVGYFLGISNIVALIIMALIN